MEVASENLSGPSLDERARQAEELTERAHTLWAELMTKHGNVLSLRHIQAGRDLLDGFSRQALGIDPGRYAYAMPCGAGKTLGMVCWIAAAHGLKVGVSVAVSASQIEALCQIKDDMLALGIPERSIGVRHTYGNSVRWPDTGTEDRPVILVSHERIKGGKDVGFRSYRGELRSLLFWDESLIPYDADSLSWRDVEGSVSLTLRDLSADSPLRRALTQALCILKAEIAAQESGAQPRTLSLMEDSEISAMRDELTGCGRGRSKLDQAAATNVRALLRLAQLPVAVALPKAGLSNDGLIHYKVSVDPALGNIAVLDASFQVRTLARGAGIQDRTTEAMRTCKTYERVTVQEVRLPTGRSTLKGQRLGDLVKHTGDAMREAQADACTLICTFKDHAAEKAGAAALPIRGLLAGLKAAGHSLKSKITVRGKAVPRFPWLTWGNHTSINEFSHCEHVILAGVLRRNHLDLAASMAGHKDDLSYRLTKQGLMELELSEIAHCVLQAMNRGSCRTVDGQGRAGAMRLTIIADVPGLREALAGSLPSVQWETMKPPSKRSAAVSPTVTAYLKALPADLCRVSCRVLKQATDCATLKQAAWEYALAGALFGLRSEWRHVRRSVVRVPAAGT